MFYSRGLTVSYVTLELLKSKGRSFNYFAFVLFRWLRYTPNLIGVILLYLLLPHFGSGPIFKENINFMYKPCEQLWWRNLLYINNFYDASGTVRITVNDMNRSQKINSNLTFLSSARLIPGI